MKVAAYEGDGEIKSSGDEEVSRFHIRSPRLAQPERAVDFAKDVAEEPGSPADGEG